MSVEFLETRAFKYELSIEINAAPPEVWTALIEETDAWWLPDFHILGTGSGTSRPSGVVRPPRS